MPHLDPGAVHDDTAIWPRPLNAVRLTNTSAKFPWILRRLAKLRPWLYTPNMRRSVSYRELQERFVFEDEHLVVLNKPTGLSVMGDREDPSVVDLAAAAGVNLNWVHRIDKDTSGLVLLAKDHETHSKLTRQFSKRSVDKTYLAWVLGSDVPERGAIVLPLRLGRKGRVRVAGMRDDIVWDVDNRMYGLSTSPDGERRSYPSRSEFVRLASDGDCTLLELKPITGRRHQLRVHLAWIGYPILGDRLFVPGSADRLMLHSYRLSLEYGSLGARPTWEVSPDADFGPSIIRRR